MKYTLATIEAVEALQVDAEQTRITAVGNLFSPPKSVAWRSLEWLQIVSKKGHLPSAVRYCNGHILSYLISASILSNLGAHLISYLIYGCGLVSS